MSSSSGECGGAKADPFADGVALMRLPTAQILSQILSIQSMGRKAEESHHKRRARRPWTEEEIKKLLVGVSWCGSGNWSRIHTTMGFDPKRSFTDLKDKWRNLLDRRCNARTSVGLKNIALYIRDQQGGASSADGHGSKRQFDPPMPPIDGDWKSAFERLERGGGSYEAEAGQITRTFEQIETIRPTFTVPILAGTEVRQGEEMWQDLYSKNDFE